MFEQEIKELEQELVKLEATYAFINSDGVRNEIYQDSFEKIEDLYERIMSEYGTIENKTMVLKPRSKFSDFQFINECSNAIRKSKHELNQEFAPYMVKSLESRVFSHLTGKPPKSNTEDEDDAPTEDFTIIFDSLIENEYEFCTLLMEPKSTLQDKFSEMFPVTPSPVSALQRITLLESLKQSKSVYESQITEINQKNLELQKELEACQQKLFEVGLKHRG